jgi:hypothetical protein
VGVQLGSLSICLAVLFATVLVSATRVAVSINEPVVLGAMGFSVLSYRVSHMNIGKACPCRMTYRIGNLKKIRQTPMQSADQIVRVTRLSRRQQHTFFKMPRHMGI